jgi:hypothetical protein
MILLPMARLKPRDRKLYHAAERRETQAVTPAGLLFHTAPCIRYDCRLSNNFDF